MEGLVASWRANPDDEGTLARPVVDYPTNREMGKAMMVVEAKSCGAGR